MRSLRHQRSRWTSAKLVGPDEIQELRILQIHLGLKADCGLGEQDISVCSTIAIAKNTSEPVHSSIGGHPTAHGPGNVCETLFVATSKTSSSVSPTALLDVMETEDIEFQASLDTVVVDADDIDSDGFDDFYLSRFHQPGFSMQARSPTPLQLGIAPVQGKATALA